MGRPSQRLLDRERIGRGALELIDSQGEFSMPGLADHLGVAVSSLYHHVTGRADVVELVRAQVVSAIEIDALDDVDWERGWRTWLNSYRDAFASHPHAIGLLATTTVRDPLSHEMYDRAVGLLQRAGFPLRDIVAIITAAESLVLGSALDTVAPPTMVAIGTPHDTPRLEAALAHVGGQRARAAFDIGVDVLVAGLHERLTGACARENLPRSGNRVGASEAGGRIGSTSTAG